MTSRETDNAAAPGQYGRLRWDGGDVVQGEGINLVLTPALSVPPSTDGTIAMFKSQHVARLYCDRLCGIEARNFVEVGVYNGGSAIFFTHLLPVKKYVGLEFAGSAPHLDRYIERMGLQDLFHLHYNTDQADKPRLTQILDQEFGETPIDIATDDASHDYSATKASFEIIFPRIRTGGYFILEDWAGHALGATGPWEPPPQPLHNLVMELVLLNGLRPDIVAQIEIHQATAFIKRGPAKFDGEFSLKEQLTTQYFGPIRFGNTL